MSVAAASTSYVLSRYSTTLACAAASPRLLYTGIHSYGHRHTTSSRRHFASAPPAQPATPPRPFTFHVGVSFIGKPVTSEDPPPISKPFPHDHPAVTFRDKMLGWPKEVPSDETGHDFFFVQNVCSKSISALLFVVEVASYFVCADADNDWCSSKMRNKSVPSILYLFRHLRAYWSNVRVLCVGSRRRHSGWCWR